jgi:ribonuclease HI
MQKRDNSYIEIYCDGACSGNPGEAGSGLAIYSKEKISLMYGGYEEIATNNIAELKALYVALKIASKYKSATIKIDSKYSMDSVTKWAYNWKKNGWKKKGGEIKNLEIIQLSHQLYNDNIDKITIEYVKGHSGVEGNELADKMARLAIEDKQTKFKIYDTIPY